MRGARLQSVLLTLHVLFDILDSMFYTIDIPPSGGYG